MVVYECVCLCYFTGMVVFVYVVVSQVPQLRPGCAYARARIGDVIEQV